MDKSTLQQIIKAFNCASKDATRYALTHVRVSKIDNDTMEIVSTNGYALSKVQVKDNFADQLKTPIFFHVDQEKILKLILKGYKYVNTIKYSIQTSTGILTLKTLEETSVCASCIDPNYPDISQFDTALITSSADDLYSTSFDVKYLLALTESMQLNKETRVKMQFNKKQTLPIIVSIEGNRGLLMPCRI